MRFILLKATLGLSK